MVVMLGSLTSGCFRLSTPIRPDGDGVDVLQDGAASDVVSSDHDDDASADTGIDTGVDTGVAPDAREDSATDARVDGGADGAVSTPSTVPLVDPIDCTTDAMCGAGGVCLMGVCAPAVALHGGAEHMCLRVGDQFTCWGNSSNGTTANAPNASVSTPPALHGAGSAGAIAAMANYTYSSEFIVGASRTVGYLGGRHAFGDNSDTSPVLTNAALVADTAMTRALANGAPSGVRCAITMDHRARCYGCGAVGALGDGMNRACGSAPVVLPMTDVVQVVVARSYQYDAFRSSTVCARSRAGAVRCWGINDRGQRGIGTTDSIATVSPAASAATDIVGHTFSWITAAESSICGIAEGGRVLCWGERTHYRGFGTDTAQPTPEVITGPGSGALPDMRQVQCGNFNCCAVSTRNELYCWGTQQIAGSNARVIPGGPATEVVAPTEVRPAGIAPGSIEALGLGSSICVVGRDAVDVTRRALVCWGDNDNGQSGAAPSTASAGFTRVPITGAGF